VNDPVPGNNTGGPVITTIPQNVADLAIQKNGPAVVAPGSNVIYTLTIINNGPNAANGATFSDPVPSAITVTGVVCANALGGAACPTALTASQTVSGSIPTLPPGGSVVITINGTATTSTATFNNVATVTAPPNVSDPIPGNNTSTVTTSVGVVPGTANLSVTKIGTQTVQVNGAITYTIRVANAGPSAADGATFSDNVPAAIGNVAWTCSASGGAQCATASGMGNAIAMTIARFPMSGELIFTVTGRAPASAQTLMNTATVTSPPGVPDPDPTNNTSSTPTTVTTMPPTLVADVTVSKIGPASVAPFGAVTYTVVVTNKGPDAANNTVLSDLVPAALTSVSTTCSASLGAQCPAAVASGNNINATIPVLPAFGTVTFTIRGTAPATGTFSNTAVATPPPTVGDPDVTNNTGGPVITSIPVLEADVAIQKNGPAVVGASAMVTYTLTITNNGPAGADNATFQDAVPALLTGIAATCGNAQGGAQCPASVSVMGQNVSGSIPRLPSGASVEITITGTGPNTLTSWTNTATVAPPPTVTDRVPANNTSSVTTRVGVVPSVADLGVIKTGTSAVQAGGAIRYNIDVTNAGPGAADGALFVDNVPASITGVTWTCAAAGGAVCPAAMGSGNAISQTIARLPMNGRLTYTVTGTAAAGSAMLVNTATITPPVGVTDPTATNNTSSTPTTVTSSAPRQSDVAVSKVGPATIQPGGAVSYTISVVNNGPDPADGTVISDPVPAVITGVATTCAAQNGAVCPSTLPAGNNIVATIPTLPPFGVVRFTVTGNGPMQGTFQNSAVATVPTGTTDPDVTNNTGGPVITTIPINPQIDVVKRAISVVTDGPSQYRVTYRMLVKNTGNIDNPKVQVNDNLANTFAEGNPVVRGGVSNVTAPCVANSGFNGVSDTRLLTGTTTLVPGQSCELWIVAVLDYRGGFVPRNPQRNTAYASSVVSVEPNDGFTFTSSVARPPVNAVASDSSSDAALPPDTPNGDNPTPTDVTFPVADSDLAIEKTGPATVNAGEAMTYRVVVTNVGQALVLVSRLIDTLPEGFTVTGLTCTGICPASERVTVANFIANDIILPPLLPGARVEFVVTGTAPQVAGMITNRATVSLTVPDINPTNNTASVTTNVVLPPQVADLSITKTGPAIANNGDSITYTLVVRNAGPVAVRAASVRDALPASGFTATAVACTGGTGGAGCPATAPTLTTIASGYPVDLPVGGTLTLTLTGRVTASEGALTNNASITPPEGITDPVLTNNDTATTGHPSGPVITSIASVADLVATKSGPTTARPGEAISYEITLRNAGPNGVRQARVTDVAPTGITFTGVTCRVPTGSSATCPTMPTLAGLTGGGISVDLANGASLVFVVTARVDALDGTITNVARITPPASVTDPNTTNNVGTSPVLMVRPDPITLFISKVAGRQTAEIGETVEYTVQVRLVSGPARAPVSVEDLLPAGFRFVGGSARLSTGGAATRIPDPQGAPGRALVFALGTLEKEAIATLSYRVQVGVGAAQGDGINQATAVSGTTRSLTARAQVKVGDSVFNADGCITGKVYASCDTDHMQSAEQVGIAGVRLYLEDGRYVITDADGKFGMCAVKPKTHVLKLDKTSLPVGAKLFTTSSRNAGDPGSLFVDIKYGELFRADFRVDGCDPAVSNQLKARKVGGVESTPQTERKDAVPERIFDSKKDTDAVPRYLRRLDDPVKEGGVK
jgi:uncharacterized repeat protein (TIGR01451 family)